MFVKVKWWHLSKVQPVTEIIWNQLVCIQSGQTTFNESRGCLSWTGLNSLLVGLKHFRAQHDMSQILSTVCGCICTGSTCAMNVPVMFLGCTQVCAPARATVTRITEAAPRSVRWSEDWSSAPVTPDTD